MGRGGKENLRSLRGGFEAMNYMETNYKFRNPNIHLYSFRYVKSQRSPRKFK